MKKTKRYDEGGGVDVEDMKTNANEGKGIFSGAPAEDDGMRPGKNLALETSTTTRKVVKPAPKASQSFPVNKDIGNMRNASLVMKGGQPSSDRDTRRDADIGRYFKTHDLKEVERVNKVRKDAADERRNTARSTVASSPVTGAGFKKGGSVGSASKRADGIAQKGKTKGRMI